MMPRDCAQRELKQQELWNTLSGKAALIRTGPDELEPLSNWVRGLGTDEELGILVQQLLGRLFASQFVATQESWRAARSLWLLPIKRFTEDALVACQRQGQTRETPSAGMVNEDLSAVNASGLPHTMSQELSSHETSLR